MYVSPTFLSRARRGLCLYTKELCLVSIIKLQFNNKGWVKSPLQNRGPVHSRIEGLVGECRTLLDKQLGLQRIVIVNIYTFSSISIYWKKSAPSYLLQMRWIYRLDFLCFIGPSLGYLWITNTPLSQPRTSLLYNLSKYLLFLSLFICLHSLFCSLFSCFITLFYSVCLYLFVWSSLKLKMFPDHHFSPPCLHCHPNSYIRMVSESFIYFFYDKEYSRIKFFV